MIASEILLLARFAMLSDEQALMLVGMAPVISLAAMLTLAINLCFTCMRWAS
jgi:hypothetical protein